MKRWGHLLSTLFVLAAINVPSTTRAGGDPPAPGYSGDIMTRSTMTGDWGGLRNELASKGMTFDISVTQVGMGVVNGGRSEDWNYAGRGDFIFTLDTQKFGLMPGGYFNFEAEGNWGETVNRSTGALMFADSSDIYPEPGGNHLEIPQVSYSQFLSPHFGVFAGKVATVTSTSGDMNDFAHGKGDQNFMNLALNVNPVVLIVPYSALAAGVFILPGKSPEDAVIQLAVLDAEGNPGTTGFDTVFKGGTIFTGEGRVKTDFFGKTGHQLVGAAYSDKLYSSLNQNFRIIVENRQLQQTSGGWSFYYNFDQYLWETAKGSGKGIGVFGRFGVSDGDPNPIKYFYSFGVGAKGPMSERPNDSFGVGYYYISTSDATVTNRLNVADEWGAEAYYNIAITPWCQLSPDIQYIDGARPNTDPAVVLGLRLKLIF